MLLYARVAWFNFSTYLAYPLEMVAYIPELAAQVQPLDMRVESVPLEEIIETLFSEHRA